MTTPQTPSAEMEKKEKCSCEDGKVVCGKCSGSGVLKEKWESIIDFLASRSFEYANVHKLTKHADYTEGQVKILKEYIRSLQSRLKAVEEENKRLRDGIDQISSLRNQYPTQE